MIEFIFHQIGPDRVHKIWHLAEGNELLYIHQGQGSLVTADRITPFCKGTLCFIGSQVRHYTLPDPHVTYIRSKIFLDDTTLAQMSALSGQTFTPHDVVMGWIAEPDTVFDRFNSDHISSSCLFLLETLKKTVDTPPKGNLSKIEQAILYIHKNLSRKLDIDELCSAVGISKFYFCRKFKEHTQCTVMDYILKTRIHMACHLIEHSHDKISEICQKTGFSSCAYFSRVFKQELGLTPLQYKNRLDRNI